MINNNMPQASPYPDWNQMLNVDSPVLTVHNTKSFFDFADADIQAFAGGDDIAAAKPVAVAAATADLEEPFQGIGAEELIGLDLNGNGNGVEGFMETAYSYATLGSASVILNLGVTEDGILLPTAAHSASADEPRGHRQNPADQLAIIPTTALELVNVGDMDVDMDVDMVEIAGRQEEEQPGVAGFVNGYSESVEEDCAFLDANLPPPLGCAASAQQQQQPQQPPSSTAYETVFVGGVGGGGGVIVGGRSCSVRSASTSSSWSTAYSHPPNTPSPFSPGCPASYPPSTPSCQSTCSDTDFAASTSSFSGSEAAASSSCGGATQDITLSLASGLKFLIPLPGTGGGGGGDSSSVASTMGAATLTALETCSLTPLIKEELKYTIQSRRLAAGKPELVVEMKPPVKVKKVMTEEERERAGKRKEQNRTAAQRFRQKQKDTADLLTKKCRKIEDSNSKLKNDIKRLAREKEELRQLLASHLLACPKVKVAR